MAGHLGMRLRAAQSDTVWAVILDDAEATSKYD